MGDFVAGANILPEVVEDFPIKVHHFPDNRLSDSGFFPGSRNLAYQGVEIYLRSSRSGR